MPWNDPLLPKRAIQGAQDYLEQPTEGQSPLMAGIKGFGSGALEGLRNLTRPTDLANIGLMAVPGAGLIKGAKAASEIPEAVSGLSNLAHITPDLVEAGQGVKQVMPTAQDALDLGGLLKHNLAKIPNAGERWLPTGSGEALKGLGAASPEFTPVGREAAYNAGKFADLSTAPGANSGAALLDYVRSLNPVQKTLKGF